MTGLMESGPGPSAAVSLALDYIETIAEAAYGVIEVFGISPPLASGTRRWRN